MVERLANLEKFLQEKSYLYKLLSFFYILPSILGKIAKNSIENIIKIRYINDIIYAVLGIL